MKTDFKSKSLNPKLRKIIINFGRTILWRFEKLIPQYSLIGDSFFFDPEKFEWVRELEDNWKVIRQELDEILKYRDSLPNFQDISPDQQYSVSRDDLWKTYFLYGYGFKAKKNCAICPETTRLIERIPGMKTAFFSILLPGKHIPEHRGPYKGVIRYFLALIVPEPRQKCRIRVGDEIRYWEEGKSMMFDDTFPHEVWNETDGVRVVLFMDIERPMRFPLSSVNKLVLQSIARSPFVRDGVANQEKWEERLTKILAEK